MTRSFDPAGLERAMAQRDVAAWLEGNGITTVHLGLVDASGTLRQKRLSLSAAARAFEQGWSFIDAIQLWGPDDQLWTRDAATSGAGTQAAGVQTDTGRPYPFGQRAAFYLAEFEAPLDQLSPRHQLQRMVERAADSGFEAQAAWEFECIVLDDPGNLDPAMTANRCWSAFTMAEQAEVLDKLEHTLSAGGVPVDHVCAELGPGCLELATGPEPALRSADSATLAKLYTKAFFAGRPQPQVATFMAQIGPGFPGLGGHPSLSLHSAVGVPLLTDEPGVLSKTGRAAIAGVVMLLPHLLAMAAPYPNSYRRFGPGNWAPATATWGMGNYSCAVRAVADHPESARLELRIPGADVSPHHCLAMFLGAALWGIEEGLEPPPPIRTPDDGRDVRTGLALPRDLTEAVTRLTESSPARGLFGDAFIDHFAASRQAEAEACHRFVSDQERARYLTYV
jgi:glutamine synthetase